jgi:hypothetical protein
MPDLRCCNQAIALIYRVLSVIAIIVNHGFREYSFRVSRIVSIGLGLLLLCLSIWGQTNQASNQFRKHHVRGTVRDPIGGVIPGTEVVFHSAEITKRILANNVGFYDAELPSGLYTMTAQASAEVNPSYRLFEKYRRPLFRVGSSDPVLLDITLYPTRACDGVSVAATQEEQDQSWADACGGEDSFDIQPKLAPGFQLYIRFLRRSFAGKRREYAGGVVANPNIYAPVRMEYNLCSLSAQHLTYDPAQQTVEAKGSVVFTDQSGKPQQAEQMILHLSDGLAIPVH